MKWLICIPAWGPRCVDLLLDVALPSLRAATLGHDVRYLIHTDARERVAAAVSDLNVVLREKIDPRSIHHVLGGIHREAIEEAQAGEIVCFMCADVTVSIECFKASEARFAQGKRLIMATGTRTVGVPPIGCPARQLLSWAFDNPHHITNNCFWGKRNSVSWGIYFQNGENISLRAFHLHPFALLKERALQFEGVTVDYGLADQVAREQIHVVTNPDEMALVETSPVGKRFASHDFRMTTMNIAEWAIKHTIPVHRWFFQKHEIVIKGQGGQCGEQALCDEIIRKVTAIEVGDDPHKGMEQWEKMHADARL